MIANFMTWNTGLFMYGNRFGKKPVLEITDSKYEEIFTHIRNFLDTKDHAIVVLQEIPYVSNLNWKSHPLFEKFMEAFQKDCVILYNKIKTDKALKMTVVLTKKQKEGQELLHPAAGAEKDNNCYVSFQIANRDTAIAVLAVHAHDAFECREYLARHSEINYSLMLGDFNAGNYIKKSNDNEIAVNRQNYLLLTEGYIDICQGEHTTKYRTYIDHVLLKSSYDFLQTHKVTGLCVDRSVKLSDHYPITFQLEW